MTVFQGIESLLSAYNQCAIRKGDTIYLRVPEVKDGVQCHKSEIEYLIVEGPPKMLLSWTGGLDSKPAYDIFDEPYEWRIGKRNVEKEVLPDHDQ